MRTVNEDSTFGHPDGMFWAVADGMGRYDAGDTASEIVVEELGKIHSCDKITELIPQC